MSDYLLKYYYYYYYDQVKVHLSQRGWGNQYLCDRCSQPPSLEVNEGEGRANYLPSLLVVSDYSLSLMTPLMLLLVLTAHGPQTPNSPSYASLRAAPAAPHWGQRNQNIGLVASSYNQQQQFLHLRHWSLDDRTAMSASGIERMLLWDFNLQTMHLLHQHPASYRWPTMYHSW